MTGRRAPTVRGAAPVLKDSMRKIMAQKYFWPLGALALASVTRSPALALVLGALLALLWGNPRNAFTGTLSRYSLQLAVVLLGFGLELAVILQVGASSLGITFCSILLTMGLCQVLGRLFRVDGTLTTLIGGGTAICGGSAIAAVSPAIGAGSAPTALALAIVFVLNGVALLAFPLIGRFFGLGQEAFGLWAALAIHDTSSVVGATAIYGAQALAVGTTVKLTRALWILPLSLTCARMNRRRGEARIPWFLGGFLLAAMLRSFFAGGEIMWAHLAGAGRFFMVATLFLIGAGLTRQSLGRIGVRPLALAVVLWLIVSSVSLVAVKSGWLKVGLPV